MHVCKLIKPPGNPVIFKYMKNLVLKKKLMNVSSIQFSVVQVPFSYTKGSIIQERSHMTVNNMANPSQLSVVFECMKYLTILRNPLNASSKCSVLVTYPKERKLKGIPANVSSVASPLFLGIYFKCMKGLILQRSAMNVKYVANPSFIPLFFKDMKERILEKNLTNANSVVRPSEFRAPFDYMKELILRINLLNVNIVVKPSGASPLFKYMKESILEKNPLSVSNVTKHLDATVPFKGMKELIVMKNRMTVSSVVRPFDVTGHFRDMGRLMLGKKLHESE